MPLWLIGVVILIVAAALVVNYVYGVGYKAEEEDNHLD